MAFELPNLPYAYNALEPIIDAQTMELHHSKHHQTYVDKLNAALEGHDDLAAKSIETILREIDSVPESIRGAIINHGGGHANHSLFWQLMAPVGQGGGLGIEFGKTIDSTFGTFDEFKKQFLELALSHFGSGWAWLVKDQDGKLVVYSKSNQDSPLMLGHTPLLGLDVWEHAYYLKYQNRRKEYVDAWWQLVNWSKVSELAA